MTSTIFRFPNLATVRAHLHGGGYRYLEDLPDADRHRPPVDAAGQRLGLTRAALNSGVRDLDEVFRATGCPPKVFVSYRWESPEIIEWVERLARHIEGRGFQVLLDQDVEVLRSNDPVDIGRYIAGIVECSVVVCVMTPQYLAGMAPRAWLFEERQLMNLLARRGAAIVRIRRDGDPPVPRPDPASFDPRGGVTVEIPVDDAPGALVDMRGTAADRFELLDALFTYTGPAFAPGTHRPFRSWLDAVARALDAGDVAGATAAFARGGEFRDAVEARGLAAHLAHARHDTAEAVRLAAGVATDRHSSAETLLDVSFLLQELGEPRSALGALGRLPSWLGAEWSWRVHTHQGSLLGDLGSPVAALAHLKHALSLADGVTVEPRPGPRALAHLHTVLGYVLLFSFGDPAAALPHLTTAWQVDPVVPHGVNLVLCQAAGGDYPAAERTWQLVEPALTPAERTRFAGLADGLASRSLPAPGARARPPGSGPGWWTCPRCSSHLAMGETALLCAGCGTSFSGTRCTCCRGNALAGMGRAVTGVDRAPSCPICSGHAPMYPFDHGRDCREEAAGVLST